MLRSLISKKSILIVGGILGVLALLAVVIWRHFVEEERDGRVAWETYRAAAEQRGVKLFIRDMIAPDVADEENYAAIPFIREMFHEGKPSADIEAFSAFSKGKDKPKPKSVAKGESSDLGAWQAYLVKCKLLETTTEDVSGDVLRGLEKLESQLQQFREASPRPLCKFPTRWEDGMSAKMPHLPQLMGVARIFELRMCALLAKGDSAAALAEFEHGMRLSGAVATEPSTIAALVRVATLFSLERAVWNGLAAHQWNEGDLLAIERKLAGIRLFGEFQAAIETERGGIAETLLELTAKSSREILQAFEGVGDMRLKEPMFPFVLTKRKLYHNVVAIHECIDAVVASYKAAAGDWSTMVMGNSFSADAWLSARATAKGRAGDYYNLAHFSVDRFDSIEKKFFEAHTRLEQTALSCALERYWIKNRAFPEQLDELVPQFIAEVPRDVADGKPLRYRRNPDGGYDIWSIGADRKDDGGAFDPIKTESEQADWIWHMPGSAKAP